MLIQAHFQLGLAAYVPLAPHPLLFPAALFACPLAPFAPFAPLAAFSLPLALVAPF
jgi:hypothetical protein